MWLVRGTFWVWGFVGLRAFFCGGTSPPTPGFLWGGDQSPHAPPKCAHLGAFHEVVRLGCVVFGLGGVGLRAFFCVIFDFFVLLSRQEKYPFPSPSGLGGRSWWR